MRNRSDVPDDALIVIKTVARTDLNVRAICFSEIDEISAFGFIGLLGRGQKCSSGKADKGAKGGGEPDG